MDLIVATGNIPFRWKGKNYKIKSLGIANNLPYAEVESENTELVNELKKRVKRDRRLEVYLGPGYKCFI